MREKASTRRLQGALAQPLWRMLVFDQRQINYFRPAHQIVSVPPKFQADRQIIIKISATKAVTHENIPFANFHRQLAIIMPNITKYTIFSPKSGKIGAIIAYLAQIQAIMHKLAQMRIMRILAKIMHIWAHNRLNSDNLGP